VGKPSFGITSDIPTQAWCTLDGKTVYSPSTDWSLAGPIIERERIQLMRDPDGWFADSDRCHRREPHEEGSWCTTAHGGTVLIAAMRAYVASKFGEEIELP
jgi:hypothetical protein